MVATWVQGILSTMLVFFCMYLIAVGNKADSAWTLLSSILAYWMPSPAGSTLSSSPSPSLSSTKKN